MIRKIHLPDSQINANLLTKIYFSVIFLLAIKLNSICNLRERLFCYFCSDHRINNLANFFELNIRNSTCYCLPPGVPTDLKSGVKKCLTYLFCGFAIRSFFAC